MILMLNFIYNSFQKLMRFHLCFSHFVSISRLQICIVSNNPFIIWFAVCQECFIFFCSSWKKLKIDVKNHLLNIRSHMTQLLMRHMHKGYIHANISHSTILRGNGNVWYGVVYLLVYLHLDGEPAEFLCRRPCFP